MTSLRLLALGAAVALTGCDVAVAIGLIVRANREKSDDAPPAAGLPAVEITATDPLASEAGGNTGEFTVTRTGDTSAALDVFFTVTGSATAPADYAPLVSPVTIPAGLASATLVVTPANDPTAEGVETVIVTISAAASYTVVSPGNATVLIDDDDDNNYHVWVANLDTTQAASEQGSLNINGGNPSGLVWTELFPTDVVSQTVTAHFDVPPGTFNTILIQVSDAQVYEIDAVEVMDTNGVVVEWANGTIYSARMSGATANNITGTPDGVTANTAATPGNKAIIFTRYQKTFDLFRVNLWWPGARASGDLEWVQTFARPSDQTAGGAGVKVGGGSNGHIFASFHDDATRDIWVLWYNSGGSFQSSTLFATGVTATVGSHAVAVDNSNSFVYVAGTVETGNIAVEKYDLAMADQTGAPNFFKTSFSGAERVENNSIAIDSAGSIILAGGVLGPPILVPPSPASIDHWMMKVDSGGGQSWLLAPTVTTDPTDTWWHGVAVGALDALYATGDFSQSGFTDLFTGKVDSVGTAQWERIISNAGQTDLGSAVAVDGSDNIVIGGYQTVAGQGRNGVIHKYTNAGGGIAPFPLSYNGAAGGDDEILDLTVDPSNDAIYAVGYETAAGQGKNLWIRRYSSTGGVIWTRTHHHAGDSLSGDDRGVSVMLSGNIVWVVGDVTLSTGEKDIHVRKYVK